MCIRDRSRLGIDPVNQANTVILTQADIVRRLVPSTLLKREDLDAGVLACLEARDACRGWEITAAHILKARTGNFFADFTNFSRRTMSACVRMTVLALLTGSMPSLDNSATLVFIGTRASMV